MTIKNISIIETGNDDRISTLAIYSQKPDQILVSGNLPHGYTFRPTTADDRDALVNWLASLSYGGDTQETKKSVAVEVLDTIHDEIEAFDVRCQETQQTDTGEVWDMLRDFQHQIKCIRTSEG